MVDQEQIKKLLKEKDIELNETIPVVEKEKKESSYFENVDYMEYFPEPYSLLVREHIAELPQSFEDKARKHLLTEFSSHPEVYIIMQYPNGQLYFLWHMKNNVLEGKQYTWFDNGKLMCEENYLNGGREGKESHWFEAGEKKAELIFANGQLNGKQQQWHNNGQLETEGNFVDGKPEGPHQEWFSDGQLTDETTYLNGEFDGVRKEWFQNGQLQSEEKYVNGKLISSKYWNEEGNLVEEKDTSKFRN
ncbi:toxin-antitoxin system YwqK family antitoxin [Candidatus Woesearchaeota archaeon]|jgi:antitoxin component YwqK of YwqJK toxin-antitoxin module|nr:toxin-antitoxin system YwqK family antitoxin [Candidatus Woesearchaeota archaeon]MBT5342939.1 toxin-antitoxin system YwqK family antitoxin [Candidatus Woesearchaeota archaeon]